MKRKECFPYKRSKPTRGGDDNHTSSPPTAHKKSPSKKNGLRTRKTPRQKRRKVILEWEKPLIRMTENELDDFFDELEDEFV